MSIKGSLHNSLTLLMCNVPLIAIRQKFSFFLTKYHYLFFTLLLCCSRPSLARPSRPGKGPWAKEGGKCTREKKEESIRPSGPLERWLLSGDSGVVGSRVKARRQSEGQRSLWSQGGDKEDSGEITCRKGKAACLPWDSVRVDLRGKKIVSLTQYRKYLPRSCGTQLVWKVCCQFLVSVVEDGPQHESYKLEYLTCDNNP